MLKKEHIRLLSVLVAVVTSLPFIGGVVGGIYVWLSPNVMLASVIAVRSVVLFNLLGFIVLLLCFYRKRWFCGVLCPTGWCCQFVSGKVHRPRSIQLSANIGKFLAIFTIASAIFGYPLLLWADPLVIFTGFFTIFRFEELSVSVIVSLLFFPVFLLSQWMLPHSWCTKICPLGGTQDMLWTLRSIFFGNAVGKEIAKPARQNGFTRRDLLASFSGLLLGGFLRTVKSKPTETIRPPASIRSPQFETLCLRCGNCLRACPTQIIKRNTQPTDWYAWMTPRIDFTDGYCLSDCTICGTVCPSGAISPFTIPAKKILPIGKARIDTENCLLQIPTECNRCKTACDYDAIKMISMNGTKVLPQLDETRCVGCGACAQICPEGVIIILECSFKPEPHNFYPSVCNSKISSIFVQKYNDVFLPVKYGFNR